VTEIGEDEPMKSALLALVAIPVLVAASPGASPPPGAVYSPDGRTIAFERSVHQGDDGIFLNENGLHPGISRNIYVVRPNASELRALTHARGGTEQNYDASWSPDGGWMAFTREPDAQRTPGIHGEQDVKLMRADGTDLRRIAAPPRGGHSIDWDRER
jgi:Tol biopolymer transport system component